MSTTRMSNTSGKSCLRGTVFILGMLALVDGAMGQERELAMRRPALSGWSPGKLGIEDSNKVVPKDELAQALSSQSELLKPSNCDLLAKKLLRAQLFGGEKAAVAQFTPQCMNDWTERLSAANAPFDLQLSSVLGVLQNNTGKAFCTGFRVSAQLVATAKHCFFDRVTGVSVNSIDATRFRLANNKRGYPISQIVCGMEGVCDRSPRAAPFSSTNDVILLEVPEIADIDMPAVVFAKDVSVGEAVILVGMSEEFGSENRLRSDGDPAGCAIAVRDSVCLFHSCHAGTGYSGAPLLRPALNADGALVLMGMHLEGVGTHGSECRAPNLKGVGNVALVMSEKFQRGKP